MSARFLGIPIVASPNAPKGGDTAFSDWRERLARNLARPSTGRWEPLTRILPNVFLIGGTFRAHPEVIAAFYVGDAETP